MSLERKKTRRGKREGESHRWRGETSERTFMFPIRRLSSQHVPTANGPELNHWGRSSGAGRTVHRFKIITPLHVTKGSKNSQRMQTLEDIGVDERTEMGRWMSKQSGGNPEPEELKSRVCRMHCSIVQGVFFSFAIRCENNLTVERKGDCPLEPGRAATGPNGTMKHLIRSKLVSDCAHHYFKSLGTTQLSPHSKKAPGSDLVGVFLCVVCMLSPCLLGFSSGALTSSHSPKNADWG